MLKTPESLDLLKPQTTKTIFKLTSPSYQMDEPSSCEPYTDKGGDKLGQSNPIGGFKHVEVL